LCRSSKSDVMDKAQPGLIEGGPLPF
jgi:hypothetical protein